MGSIRLGSGAIIIVNGDTAMLLGSITFVKAVRGGSGVARTLFSTCGRASGPFSGISIIRDGLASACSTRVSGGSVCRLRRVVYRSGSVNFDTIVVKRGVRVAACGPARGPGLVFTGRCNGITSRSVSFSARGCGGCTVILKSRSSRNGVREISISLSGNGAEQRVVMGKMDGGRRSSGRACTRELCKGKLRRLLGRVRIGFISFVPPASLFKSVCSVKSVLAIVLGSFSSGVGTEMVECACRRQGKGTSVSVKMKDPVVEECGG